MAADPGTRKMVTFQTDIWPCATILFQWFPLETVSQGKLHLRLEWLTPLARPEALDQVSIDPVCAAAPPPVRRS